MDKKEVCNHNKAYSNFVLTTYPTQHPWICRICGEKGIDRGGGDFGETYSEVVARFKERESDL